MERNIPEELDWVTARSECSVYAVFKKLEIGVKSDVDNRNRRRPQGEPVKWQVVASGGKRFSVIREDNVFPVPRSDSVDFELGKDGISISDGEGLSLLATIVLNNEGRCMLRVGGAELEEWQLRRMSLEKLFFG